MLPDFLIIGAMKSGTSALARGVTAHPEAAIAAGKELHYFDRYFSRGQDWYESFFPGRETGVTMGEATPYLGDEVAMKRLVATVPGARLVAILRQPADRAYSHYWHNRRRNREELSFEDALSAEPDRLDAGEGIFGYFVLGRYATQLNALIDEVPRHRLLVVLTEDLREHREATLRRVWEHIGVDPKSGDTIQTTRSRRRMFLRTAKARVRGRVDDDYPPIDPVIRNRLTSQYDDEITALESIIERDLSHWR